MVKFISRGTISSRILGVVCLFLSDIFKDKNIKSAKSKRQLFAVCRKRRIVVTWGCGVVTEKSFNGQCCRKAVDIN